MSNRNFTSEEWKRLEHLITDRLQSRIWLMEETLKHITDNDPGGELNISITALEGVYYMVADMKKELDEALGILDF
jgi:hypothetical protein